MAIKKSQLEDKALRPEEDGQGTMNENKEGKKKNEKEFNYPDQRITLKAKNKKEADKKLKEITN